MDLLHAVVVHAANVHDSKGATDVIALLKGRFTRLVKIVTDGGYRGELIEKTKTAFGWILEIVLRSDHSSKFAVIPQRQDTAAISTILKIQLLLIGSELNRCFLFFSMLSIISDIFFMAYRSRSELSCFRG